MGLVVHKIGRGWLPAVLLACAALLAGCDDVTRSAFGGVIGVVGHPAIGNCRVEVYNAIEFRGLDSTDGLIAEGRTTEAGRFEIRLSERHLGRPLILVARPDSQALYRDFGAPGAPDLAFDETRQPWVAVHNEWLGAEAIVSINPLTTMAFHSLMRLPAEQVGEGALRFDIREVNGVHAALAANFGLRSNLSIENPAPPAGPDFETLSTFYRENNDRSTAYTYICLQLAKAANEFVALAGDPNRTALDFYEALYQDATDGTLDGMVHGEPEPYLGLVPAVVGHDTDGASRLVRWISTQALTPTEEGYAGAARGGRFLPRPEVMLALQEDATGAIRPTRIRRFDVRNFPTSGNVHLTIEGEGFRRSDRFLIRSFADPRHQFVVDRDGVGVDGEFLYHSDKRMVIRLPDFEQTTRTVPSNLRIASGTNFRRVRFLLQNQPELRTDQFRDVLHSLTDNARLTDRSELLLVNLFVGRVDAGGDFISTTHSNALHDDTTDPATLDPATDDVFELRARLANPGPDAIEDITLDYDLSLFTQLGEAIVADVFGGTEPGRALVFEDLAPLTIPAGEVVDFSLRFVFIADAIPADLALGAPVRITPTWRGVSTGPGTPEVTTSDVVGFNRSVEIGPATPDATALIDTPSAPLLPLSVDAGETFEIELPVAVVAQSGTAVRTLRVDWLDVVINFDGEQTRLRITDSFFETPGASGLYFERATLADGARAMPLSLHQSAPGASIFLRVRTDPARSGALSAEFTAHGTDTATGRRSTATSGSAGTVINP